MPLYYFDMADTSSFRDEDGIEYADDVLARHEAMRTLTGYAADTASSSSGRQVFTILVSNARRKPIYSATLALNGGEILPRR